MDGLHMHNLAWKVARHYFIKPGVDFGDHDHRDMIQAGICRALKDLQRWDPAKGDAEVSWAWNSMYRGMQDHLRNQRPGKRNKTVRISVCSLDEVVEDPDFGPGSGTIRADYIPDERIDVENEVCNDVGLAAAIATLSPKLRFCVCARYFHDWTNRDIAAVLGVTESRASQLVKKARDELAKLINPTTVSAGHL